ncbi:histidine kinase [Erythrobacter sp. QSSC1-22B]|uniref:sensor histidine kinase n=1 Tax=Erythrobacter sp. QSSC1-22B TaxID=1860125 RepID=UPI000805B4C0|nr:histidine kinase [Erythrobacter sp. QSSC1-22B]OBX20056.1 histidine kinase [Erythrobacter sp. QSSC1-22B]
MAVLPIQPTPFFANKNRAFWYLQLGGWGGAFLLRAISAFANTQPLDFLVIILIQAVTGFSLSLVLSVIYRQLINRRPLVTWSSTALALVVAVGINAFVDSWVLDLARPSGETDFVRLFVGIYFYDLTVLGAWSALYYAINYFLQVEEQADRLERLEMQATSAQLEMLRYQLNPHFLFNTLNSISTLVLLKQTEPANAMLTRLSSFLRHTLVNQPGSKVTMAEEVETLMLYLDIERMRFEERLQTEFQVDPVATHACIPSMLLQPLVENAIKYGVSPQEEGATISLVAQIVGPRLRVTVSDTGPGINQGGSEELPPALIGSLRRSTSTGVGLANIRNRLAQAYGDDHRFEIRSPDSGGFTVLIEIPHEPARSAMDQPGTFPLQGRQPGEASSVVPVALPERA